MTKTKEPASWIDSDVSDLIATIQSGQRPYGGVSENGGEIPSLGGENIRQGGGLELAAVKKVPLSFFQLMTKGVLAHEDVLINKDGANTGKVGIYESQFPVASINEHLFLLRGQPDRLHQRFLYRLLSSEHAQKIISSKISGSAQPGLKSDFIRNFPVCVPKSTAEQFRIAAVLDMVDEAIAKTEAVIGKVKQVRAGLLHDLLTRGLDEHGQLRDSVAHPEQFKDSPLGRIPREWEVQSLDSVTDPSAPICYGIVQALEFVPDGVPVLTIRDLLGDYSTGVHRTARSIDANYTRSRVRLDDVLISVKGTIGRVDVVPEHFHGNISRDLARVRPNDRVRARFLVHLLRSQRGQRTLEQCQVGTTRAELSIAPLKRLSFAFPLPGEQEQIAMVLDEHDALIRSHEHELEKLLHLKSGLMNDLLTGCVRVPENITDGGGHT